LEDANVAISTSGAMIKELSLSNAGTFRFGTTGGSRAASLEFEPESVYIFQVTGFNHGGDADNPNPKSVVGSALFTTVDVDEAIIASLQVDLNSAEEDIIGLESANLNISNQLTAANTQVSNLNNQNSALTTQRNNAVNTLDGFSDDVVAKINSLKSALENEAITDTTLTQVNSLISSFNTFVPNINSNTPATSPVTQITEFDRFMSSDTDEDNSGLNPGVYPEWLGGDNILTQDNDNILFDLSNQEQTPWFNIPDLVYGSVPNELGLDDSVLQNKLLIVLRFQRVKYLVGGIPYPYLFARNTGTVNQGKYSSNKTMFQYPTGTLYSYKDYSTSTSDNHSDWFGQGGDAQTDMMQTYGKDPSVNIAIKKQHNGQGSMDGNVDLGDTGMIMNYLSTLSNNTPNRQGNMNLVSLSGLNNYDGLNGCLFLNGGQSFKIQMDAGKIPYKKKPIPIPENFGPEIYYENTPLPETHTYSVGLQFDVIVRQNTGSFVYKSRQITGNFSFSNGYIESMQ
jgi:hypothetical protein